MKKLGAVGVKKVLKQSPVKIPVNSGSVLVYEPLDLDFLTSVRSESLVERHQDDTTREQKNSDSITPSAPRLDIPATIPDDDGIWADLGISTCNQSQPVAIPDNDPIWDLLCS